MNAQSIIHIVYQLVILAGLKIQPMDKDKWYFWYSRCTKYILYAKPNG